MAGGNRGRRRREWTREPPDRTARGDRRRDRTPVGSGAERQRYRAAPIAWVTTHPSVTRVRHRRMRVAPRKARPFVPGTNGRFDSRGHHRDDHRRSDQPERRPNVSPPTPTRSCCAPRARPTSRPRSAPSCASTTANPAYLLESVEGGERLGRYSFLGVGPRRLLEVRDGHRPDPDPTGHGPDVHPDLPIETATRPIRSTPSARSSAAAASSRPRACRASPAARSGPRLRRRVRLRDHGPAARSATRSVSRRPRSSRPTSSSSSTT